MKTQPEHPGLSKHITMVDVSAELDRLEDQVMMAALDLAWSWDIKATAWSINKEGSLSFWSSNIPDDASKLPAPIGPVEALPIIMAWLTTERWPEHNGGDGTHKEGWRINNVGEEGGGFWSILTVSRTWIYYGK